MSGNRLGRILTATLQRSNRAMVSTNGPLHVPCTGVAPELLPPPRKTDCTVEWVVALEMLVIAGLLAWSLYRQVRSRTGSTVLSRLQNPIAPDPGRW